MTGSNLLPWAVVLLVVVVRASLVLGGLLSVMRPAAAAEPLTYFGVPVASVGDAYHVPGWPARLKVVAWNYDSRWYYALQNARLAAGDADKADSAETYAAATRDLEEGRLREYPSHFHPKLKQKMLALELKWLEQIKLEAIGVDTQRMADKMAKSRAMRLAREQHGEK